MIILHFLISMRVAPSAHLTAFKKTQTGMPKVLNLQQRERERGGYEESKFVDFLSILNSSGENKKKTSISIKAYV